jgi:hypothetical protein
MELFNFCGKNTNIIKDEKLKDEIINSIKSIGTYNLDSKYYQFLNFKNVNQLKNNEFKISISTFGKKYHLYLKNMNNKNYCIFINKKTNQMILGKFTFALSLFDGTLFDGELIKNSRNEWFFMINDLIYYEGKSMITYDFETRYKKVKNVIETQYKYDNNSQCKIFIKKYVELKYLNSLIKDYISQLSFKCSGICFKDIDNFGTNYTYIFPECRTDTRILNKEEEKEKVKKVEEENENIDFLSMLESECTLVSYNNNSENQEIKNENKKEVFSSSSNNDNVSHCSNTSSSINVSHCNFMVKSTHMPDIYELYCKSSSGNIEKHSYASIPSMECSKMMRKVFETKNEIIMKCIYNKIFKKWIPIEETNDNIDNLHKINKVKLFIENMEEEEI